MKIYDLFDERLHRAAIEGGFLTARRHDGYPLTILNYSDRAQFANYWDDCTLSCRGLIHDDDLNVIARPWKKFFNLGDAKAPHIGFDDLVEVTDKMDGSLGILYVWDGKPSIATRGSFHSTQAGWATKQIRRALANGDLTLDYTERYTFLFEIIYPTNRIVVDYGSFEGLVLLGCVEKDTGYAFGPGTASFLLNWSGVTTEVMKYKTISDVLAAPDRDNTEGMVIRRGNDMIKWKRPAYVELHRLISNLSVKSVWSGLASGKTIEEICDGLPDEFHGFVKETGNRMLDSMTDRYEEIDHKYVAYRNSLGDGPVNRKDFAWAVRNDPDKKYMFALLDSKPILPILWQELKPSGDAVPDDSRVQALWAGEPVV